MSSLSAHDAGNAKCDTMVYLMPHFWGHSLIAVWDIHLTYIVTRSNKGDR